MGARVAAEGNGRRLSVLVVNLVSDVWGAQRRLLDVAPRLARRGVVLSLACPAEGDLADAWRALDLPTLPLRLPAHHGLRRADGSGRRPPAPALANEAWASVRSVARVATLARPFDVIHSHDTRAHLDVALAARLARRPAVLDVHDLIVPGLGRRILHLASRLATATIANSGATATAVDNPGATRVVHPGVDLVRFRPGAADPRIRAELAADPDAPLVGIIGRVDPRKGVDVLVRALARLEGPLARTGLVVIGSEYVGTADYMRTLQAEADAALGDRVRFLRPREDVPDVLRALDVLVNASLHEPFGRTVLEAQACGVPVVGTAAGGIPEFVADGVTGLLVPPRDPDALAAALRRVLLDGDLRRRLAAAGRHQAEERFDVERQSDAVAAVYQGAASRAGTVATVAGLPPGPPAGRR